MNLNPTPIAPSIEQRNDIDGLRAIAILAVVVYHAYPGALPGGFVGVDLFFVISGYLITKIILSDIARSRFSLADFYVRRLRRTLPALILVLAAVLALGWFCLFPDELARLGKHSAFGLLFLSNINLARELDYFATSSKAMPLLHLWSLGLEEQFYLLWPLVILALSKLARSRERIPKAIALLALLSFVGCLFMARRSQQLSFFHLPFRMWELLAGAFLASLEARDFRLSPRLREWSAALGLISVILAFSLISEKTPFPGIWALLPVAGGVLLIAAGRETLIGSRLLSLAPMTFVGRISYPLYLWHWPLLVLNNLALEQPPWQAALLSAVLSVLTYRLLETPVKRRVSGWRSLKSDPLIYGAALASMVAILGSGMYTFLDDGVPGRAPGLGALQAHFRKPPLKNAKCSGRDPKLRGATFCMESDAPNGTTTALIGDSHAHHLFEGLSRIYAERGEGLLNLGVQGCPPFADSSYSNPKTIDTEACVAAYRQAIDHVLSTDEIKTVIVSFFFYDIRRWVPEIRGQHPGWASQLPRVAERLNALLNRIQAAGKRPVLVVDVPTIEFDPRKCFGRRLAAQDYQPRCPSGSDQATQRTAEFRDFYARVATGACIFDPTPLFLDGDRYSAVREGKLLYKDRHHLSPEGSRYVASEFSRSKCF